VDEVEGKKQIMKRNEVYTATNCSNDMSLIRCGNRTAIDSNAVSLIGCDNRTAIGSNDVSLIGCDNRTAADSNNL
jgi:hypothetical protein